DAARAGVAVVSPHTALDVAEGGTNDVLADLLGLADRRALRAQPASPGMGRVGTLAPARVPALVARVKEGLGVERVLVAGPRDREVTLAAVCAGSGGDFLGDVLSAGAQFYLTGEIRHHDALRAAAAGLTVVCALHSCSERVALASLAHRLGDLLPGVAIAQSAADRSEER